MFEIKQEEIEADDIIALTTKFVKKNFRINLYLLYLVMKIFYNLVVIMYILLNIKKKHFSYRRRSCNGTNKKIVNGDCSDNIPSIFKGRRIKNKKQLLMILRN